MMQEGTIKSGRRHVRELDWFNALACLMVLFMHVVSEGIVTVEHRTWQEVLIFFPWKLVEFVVPAFLFSAALKMTLDMKEKQTLRDYGRMLWRRFRKLIIPYAVWYTIYYVSYCVLGFLAADPGDFIKQFFFGTLSAQFYFVVILTQFTLLQPLWRILVKKVSAPVGILAGFLIHYMTAMICTMIRRVWPDFVYDDRILFAYMDVWVTGLYVGANYDRFKKAVIENSRAGQVLSIVVIAFFAVLSYYQSTGGEYLFDYRFSRPFTDILSIILMLTLCCWIDRKAEVLHKPLSFIHRASYQVFLSHLLVLLYVYKLLMVTGIGKLSLVLLIRAVPTFTLPFAVYALWELLLKKLKKKNTAA